MTHIIIYTRTDGRKWVCGETFTEPQDAIEQASKRLKEGWATRAQIIRCQEVYTTVFPEPETEILQECGCCHDVGPVRECELQLNGQILCMRCLVDIDPKLFNTTDTTKEMK